MFSTTALVLSLAATVFASPAPQNSDDIASFVDSLTAGLESALPSFDAGSLSSELAAASSLVGALSGIPSLPASIESVLLTAIPTSDYTNTDYACNPTAASWYNDLPGDVKSALNSYGSAVATWASDHSSDFGSYTNVPVCTGSAAGGQNGGGSSSSTGSSSSASTTAGSSGGSGSSGSSGSSSSPGGSSANGAAASTTNSPGSAPRATGAIIGSFVGIVGALGVMAAL